MALAKVRRPTGRDLYPSIVRSRQAKVILQAACSMQHAMLFPKELCSTRDCVTHYSKHVPKPTLLFKVQRASVLRGWFVNMWNLDFP